MAFPKYLHQGMSRLHIIQVWPEAGHQQITIGHQLSPTTQPIFFNFFNSSIISSSKLSLVDTTISQSEVGPIFTPRPSLTLPAPCLLKPLCIDLHQQILSSTIPKMGLDRVNTLFRSTV